MERIKCFTDASYSKDIEMSVVGYKIGNTDIVTEHLPKIKNTQAELYAIDKCIEKCSELYPKRDVTIYTDCQKANQLSKGENNAYPKNIKIEKIKGHKKKSLRDENDKIFHLVDKATRQELRRLINRNLVFDF